METYACGIPGGFSHVVSLRGDRSSQTNPVSKYSVRAKSIAAYWAVKELGLAGTVVGNDLNLTQSGVGRAVRRGEEIVKELGLSMVNEGNA